MADATNKQSEESGTDEQDKKYWIMLVIGLFALAIALGVYFAPQGSALAIAIACGLMAFAAVVANWFFREKRGTIVILTALLAAAFAGSSGAAVAYQLSHRTQAPPVAPNPVTAAPTIHINSPQGGDGISITPVIAGTITNLGASEVVWSFTEPYTTGKSPPSPMGNLYPDAGPCQVDGSSFRCNLVFAGGPGDYCRQIQLWAAVVTINDANKDANIKAGVVGNTYISLREDKYPAHVANAIDSVHVYRNPKPGSSC
jgi:flagellar basal body-associated protein FliL